MSGEISYKTHILIGVRPNGIMTVIADWPHVPRQADSSRRSTRLETATQRSRSARRRPSCRRIATEVRVEDGIGQLGLAGAEAAACVAPAIKGGRSTL